MAQCWGQTLCPLAVLSTLTTSTYLASDLPHTSNLLFTISPAQLGNLPDGSSVPGPCLQHNIPLCKGDTALQTFDLMPYIVKKHLGFFVVLEGVVFCFCFILILFWPFLSLSFHVDQIFERADDGYRCNMQLASTLFGGAFTLDEKWNLHFTRLSWHPHLSPFPPVHYLLFLLSNMLLYYLFPYERIILI